MQEAIITISILAFAAGCAPVRGDAYTVHVAPEFRVEEVGYLAQAAADWEEKTPVRLAVEVSPCPGRKDGHVCIRVSSGLGELAPGVPLLGGTSDNVHDFLDGGMTEIVARAYRPDEGGAMPPSDIQQIFAHELGHSFGLPHASEGLPLMHWSMEQASHVVTEADVCAYRDARAGH